ncbi:MAG: aminoacyl-tRNA hydrolase [Verrucomicrobiaceae bacterium]|nr:aminoacyl-tRNA hydrolase [Verrucomicrobiaceae bacterium]
MEKTSAESASVPESLIPRLIVGLGNPGNSYQDTRHNIGFMVMDVLATRLGTAFQVEKRWESHVAKFAGGFLVKPQTYMNLSGRAVGSVGRFYKITPQETLVVFDDVDLPLGRLRLRASGSAAGHNGLKSLISTLGTDQFPRVKVGIGADSGRPAGDRLVGHVLGKFSEDEKAAVAQAVDRAADAVMGALKSGLGAAMNFFNRKEGA